MLSAVALASPTSDRVQKLYRALTSQSIQSAPGWDAYFRLVKCRHRFVHDGTAVGHQDAETLVPPRGKLRVTSRWSRKRRKAIPAVVAATGETPQSVRGRRAPQTAC